MILRKIILLRIFTAFLLSLIAGYSAKLMYSVFDCIDNQACLSVYNLSMLYNGWMLDEMFKTFSIFFIALLLTRSKLDRINLKIVLPGTILLGMFQHLLLLPILFVLPVYAVGISFQSIFMYIEPAILMCFPYVLVVVYGQHKS